MVECIIHHSDSFSASCIMIKYVHFVIVQMIAQLLLRHQRFSQDELVLSRQDSQLQTVKKDPTASPSMIRQTQRRPSPPQVTFIVH